MTESLLSDVLKASLPSAARSLHVNYRYMLAWSLALHARQSPSRILDFGCGEGQVVEQARSLGLEFYGADVFYEGEEDRKKVAASGLLGTVVREIRAGKIPFDDESFDLILSNQVFEHVERLEPELAELSRVLKKTGLMVCLFPTREVFREAHCGVPFLHWLPEGSGFRVPYAEFWSGTGFSFDREKKSRRQWAADAVDWMDRFVFYRRRAEILRAFGRAFRFDSAEEHYLAYRLAQRRRAAPLVPLLRVPWIRAASRTVCRRLNGVALLARRRNV